MKCYFHRQADAVGLCRACSRGLCPECAAEVSTVLACRNRCERQAEALAAVQGRMNPRLFLGSTFTLLMCAVFIL